MSDLSALNRRVLLVTDRDGTQDIVNLFFELLPSRLDAFPGLAAFAGVVPYRRSSTQAAREELENAGAAYRPPLLIILEGMVSARNHDPNPGTGEAATEFLGWLETAMPHVPVLVQMSTSLEKLELKVLSRRNVGLLTLNQPGEADVQLEFMEAIADLTTPRHPKTRRITIDVGSDAATYHIRTDRCEFVTDAKAYSNKNTLPFLIKNLDRFTPWDSNRTVRGDWQGVLNMFGKELFNLLIKDTIGPHLREMLQAPPSTPSAASTEARPPETPETPEIELRFEINGETDDAARLFSLPFELASPDLDEAPTFLCTRIPMARRIRLKASSARGARTVADAHTPSVLFVRADVSGSVSFVYESTGARTATQWLDPLENIDAEFEALETIASESGGTLLQAPVQVGGGPEWLVGDALIRRIEAMLKTGAFDILHFSGHSTSLPDGSTYLVLPGKNGEAHPVSVCEVAQWVAAGHCELVVLSSCRGSSLRTAIETIRGGAEAVLGFRWDVDDSICKYYFERFYEVYLRGSHSVSQAYRDACRTVQISKRGSPLWASAVAVVRD